jgi:hypothetical protein
VRRLLGGLDSGRYRRGARPVLPGPPPLQLPPMQGGPSKSPQMTLYVSDTPSRAENNASGKDLYFFWGDTPEEAEVQLWTMLIDPETVFNRRGSGWVSYLIPLEVFTDLVIQGVEVTDKLGPAYFMAKRDGLTDMVQIIERARAAK